MKIAIDVDDCISNTSEVDFATCWLFNQQLNPNDNKLYYNNYHNAPTIFGFDKETDDKFYEQQRKQVVREGLIYPKIFSDRVINKLLNEGHDITILTSRGDQYWGDALAETKKWLAKYNIHYTHCVANSGSKGEYCKANNIDVMLEDNPKYAKQVNDVGIRTILILAEYNKDYKNDLNTFASCWPEVYKIINELNRKKIKNSDEQRLI